jgi:DNA-directed RNA polymerase II subunit RPB9
MLYPKEDPERKELFFTCRTCHYSEEPSTACVYRNDLSTTVGETAGITQDVGQDPTVRPDLFPELCTVCGQEILCETCGKPTALGCWLEVVDNETETFVDNNTSVGGDFEIDVDFEHDYMSVSDPMSDEDDIEYYSEFASNRDAINGIHANGIHNDMSRLTLENRHPD